MVNLVLDTDEFIKFGCKRLHHDARLNFKIQEAGYGSCNKVVR